MLRELGELEEDNETSNVSMKLRNLQMKSMGLMDSLCFQTTIEVIIDFSVFYFNLLLNIRMSWKEPMGN